MIRKLIVYLREFRRDAVIAPLLILLEAACELITPLIMANIIDKALTAGSMSYLLQQGIYLLLLSVIGMYAGVRAAKYSASASLGFGRNLRRAMFSRIQTFSFADIDRFSSASLITRLTNDVTTLQNTVAMGLRTLVRAPLQLIAALIVCLNINARLSLILMVAIPVLILSVGSLMRACRKFFTVFQQKIDGLNHAVQENLVSIRVVKAFVRETHEEEKFRVANDELLDAGLNAVMRIIMMAPIMMLMLNACIILVFWFGGKQVAAGTMLTGELYSFYSYIAQVLISVLMVAICLLQLTRAGACARRILEVLETEPDIRDPEEAAALPESCGRVEFRGVSFKYGQGSGDDVLRDISFTVEPGEFVAIMGGTGTGKSSLVNLIPRFYDVTDGAVLVDGLDVRSYPVEALRQRIGMVLQKNVLFSGTIRENLLWGNADATEEEMIACAMDAQAHEFIMAYPDGYDTFLEQGGVNVSGGQKQRLCIARAMLRHPAVLILDDATSAVDTATEAQIRRSFSERLQGTTVIMIAQRISSVRNADRIIILDDDHIAGMGTHEELLKTCSIYREIVEGQEGVIENG